MRSIESELALTGLLDRTMPGIKPLLSDFIAEYWHFDNITKKSEYQFILSYCAWSKKEGYHASESKAKATYTLACPACRCRIGQNVNIRGRKSRERSKQDSEVHFNTNAETYNYFAGIQYDSGHEWRWRNALASRLTAEIGDVCRFHSGSALIAFAGIDSTPFQSVSFTGT